MRPRKVSSSILDDDILLVGVWLVQWGHWAGNMYGSYGIKLLGREHKAGRHPAASCRLADCGGPWEHSTLTPPGGVHTVVHTSHAGTQCVAAQAVDRDSCTVCHSIASDSAGSQQHPDTASLHICRLDCWNLISVTILNTVSQEHADTHNPRHALID